MNLQQLEYIIALDQHRHFVTAAEHCFITQATLSTMIKKLEDELQVSLFDRSKQPVVPTQIGEKIIEQAKIVIRELGRMKHLVESETSHLQGELRLGIIPTLAPYLLPLFITSFLEKHPFVKLQVSELTTEVIIEKIKQNQLDAGILAISLNDQSLVEIPLFNESFVIYSSEAEAQPKKKYFLPSELDANRLWLLEEGHCLRNQVINLCELKVRERNFHRFDLTASSLETLKKVVDINQGLTILPLLATKDMNKAQLKQVRYFKDPVPGRKIGLVCFRYYVKEKLLDALQAIIMENLPEELMAEKNEPAIVNIN